MCFVVTCWERADLLALVCGVYCEFPIGILGQVWYLIVSIPDLCTLTYFVLLLINDKMSTTFITRIIQHLSFEYGVIYFQYLMLLFAHFQIDGVSGSGHPA